MANIHARAKVLDGPLYNPKKAMPAFPPLPVELNGKSTCFSTW